MVQTLNDTQQVRIPIKDAGMIYAGKFIFFTNTEDAHECEEGVDMGVPRVISTTKREFFSSGYGELYKSSEYGVPYYCSAYVAEENIPPLLAI